MLFARSLYKQFEPRGELRIRRPGCKGGFGAAERLKTSLKLNLKALTATVSDAAAHIRTPERSSHFRSDSVCDRRDVLSQRHFDETLASNSPIPR